MVTKGFKGRKVLVDALLNGSRDQDVAWFVEHGVVKEGLRGGVVGDRLFRVRELVLEQVIRTDALLVVDRAIAFDDSDQLGSSLLYQELRGKVPHVSEPLYSALIF